MEKRMKKFFVKEELASAYHGIIVNLMGKKENVVITKDDIYDQAENYIKSTGIVFKNNKVKSFVRYNIITNVVKLFIDLGYVKKIEGIDGNAKVIKNQRLEIYIPKTDLENLDGILSSKLKVPVVKKIFPAKTSSSSTSSSTKPGRKGDRIRITALMKLMRAMVKSYETGDNYISSEVIKSCGFKKVYITSQIKEWCEYFKFTTGKDLALLS